MNKFFNYAIAFAAAAFGLTSCSQDIDIKQAADETVSVNITVEARRPGLLDADSRTLATETDDADLVINWTAGDKLYVFDQDGDQVGELTILPEYAGQNFAKFSGSLTGVKNGDNNLSFFYLGTEGSVNDAHQHTADLSSQSGTIAGLTAHDVLSANVNLSVIDGLGYVDDLNLQRHFLFAHFQLTFPEGVAMNGQSVAISGDNLYNKGIFDHASTNLTTEAGDIFVRANNGDFYVTLIPGNGVAPTFTVNINGQDYEGSLNAKDLAASMYLRKGADEGVEVAMNPVKPDDEGNPGNTGNWGGEGNTNPEIETSSSVKFVAEVDGWTLNWSSVYQYGGFGTYITYKSNGIAGGGLMTSKGTTNFFFQWGRWMGFPTTVANLVVNAAGSYSGGYKYESQLPYGVNYYNTSIGYIFANSLSAAHGCVYMGSTAYTRQRALNCSIMFGMVSSLQGHGDYIGANEDCKWEDRTGGSPAPAGYRIPTAAELEALVPAADEINGTLVEFKTIDGKKYAMRWKVTQATKSYVEICSFRCNDTTLPSANDSRFDSANTIKLSAYGYIDNEGDLQAQGTIGAYWSSDSGKMGSYNGGKYLEIDFSGNTAVMGMGVASRCFGMPVLLIKDAEAQPVSLTPWFPLTGI